MRTSFQCLDECHVCLCVKKKGESNEKQGFEAKSLHTGMNKVMEQLSVSAPSVGKETRASTENIFFYLAKQNKEEDC